MHDDSFTFNGVDMYERFGIRMIHADVLQPKLRARKIVIPGDDGAHDFGAKWYDERKIKLDCRTTAGLSRADMREVSGVLSRKGRLVIWDEPEKHYVGRVYDPANLKYLGMTGFDFTLTFVCDPPAYGATVNEAMPRIFTYAGTMRTPTRIEIRNTGMEPIVGLQMTIRERRDA